MFEAVCMFLLDLQDPTRARTLNSPPAIFRIYENELPALQGLARSSAENCSVTLCEPGGTRFVRWAYVGSGACPISPGGGRLITREGVVVYSAEIPSDLRSGIPDVAGTDRITLATDVDAVTVSARISRSISGTSTIQLELEPNSGIHGSGIGYILGDGVDLVEGMSLTERLFRELVRAGERIHSISAFMVGHGAAIAIVSGAPYAGSLGSVATPSGTLTINRVQEGSGFRLRGPLLRQLAQAACLMIPTGIEAYQFLLLAPFRLEENLERLSYACN